MNTSKKIHRKHIAPILSLLCNAVMLISLSGGANGQTQGVQQIWSPPVNLSNSGAASRAHISVDPKGNTHAIWWDEIDGTLYSRGAISGTQTVWTPPVKQLNINGGSNTEQNARSPFLPPSDAKLQFGANGVGYFTYQDKREVMYLSQIINNRFGPPSVVSQDVIVASPTTDISGTLHIGYAIAPTRTTGLPAGIYYQRKGLSPRAATRVFSSPYFRTAKSDDIQLSVASNAGKNIVMTWNQRREDQSVFARSVDGGATWSEPQVVVSRSLQMGLAVQVSVAYAPNGEFLLLWRDASAPGCGFTQRRSNDGGATWSSPERVLTGIVRCPQTWSFAVSGDNTLWLISEQSRITSDADTALTLAVWDGQIWSDAVSVEFGNIDETTRRAVPLGCIAGSLYGNTMALIGCDARGDILSSRNTVDLKQIVPILKSPWSAPVGLTEMERGLIHDVDVASSSNGNIYGVWSEANDTDGAGKALVLTGIQRDTIIAPVRVILAESSSSTRASSIKIEQPTIDIDPENRFHVAWSGGESGQIFYSASFERDAPTSSGWAAPIALPSVSSVASSPSLVADSRGANVFTLYSVPFNEKRGVYLVRSINSGGAWMTPTLVFDAESAGWNGVDESQLAFNVRSETLHAVFMKLTSVESPAQRELYYTRSTDFGGAWSPPVKIASGNIDAPRIAVFDPNQVHIIFNAPRLRGATTTAPFSIWSSYSPDGGLRWSDAERIVGFEAVSGKVSLASDNAGQLVVTAIGETPRLESTLLFARWDGQAWTDSQETPLRQPATSGNQIASVITNQGLLSSIIRADALQSNGSTRAQISSSSLLLSAPKLVPVATFTPAPTLTPEATETPVPSATPFQAFPTSGPQTTTPSSVGVNSLLLAGVLGTAVAVLAAIVGVFIIRNRR
jgi:hypothetical protein